MTNLRRLLVVCAVVPVAAFAGAAAPTEASGAIVAAPHTVIHSGPTGTTRARTARFHVVSHGGVRVQCKLDRGAWRLCLRRSSGYVTLRNLRRGAHTFYARGVSRGGAVGAPARRSWRVR